MTSQTRTRVSSFPYCVRRSRSRGSRNDSRRENWQWFSESLRPLGLEPYFALPPTVVPGAYVMRLDKAVDAAKLKRDLVEAGVESTSTTA
jgi:hypothetical protein